MQCPRCQHENRPQAKFCEECAAPLASACSNCCTPLSPTAKFCPECAHPVAAGAAESRFASPESYTPRHLAEKILTSKAALEGERKQVTVLFADLKGSMELLADRDPEEARRLLDPVLERMMEAIHHYEGTVNQVMGDGIMALFGAPLAHEDHAVRACYAALRAQESLKRYAAETRRSYGVEVEIRIGLNSGDVVVRSIGNDLHMDYTAVGQTTHLAARMEQLAPAGGIWLTTGTLRLAEAFIHVRPVGRVAVKGLREPVEAFELLGVRPGRRAQAVFFRALTRFIGRERELDVLDDALRRAGAGHVQMVAVVGDPGVGKSRLFVEFAHSHRTDGWLLLESGTVSYGRGTPYLPIVDLLRRHFGIREGDDAATVREKMTDALKSLGEALPEIAAPLQGLLGAVPDDSPFPTYDPPRRRELTQDALKQFFVALTRTQPLLLIMEDLQWIDTETQSVLDHLAESPPGARLLLLVNYRPEYQHGWGGKTYYTQIRLDPLSPESAEAFLDVLLGADTGLGQLKQLMIDRTDGNPFFLEEITRALAESGALAGGRGAYHLATPVREVQVPPTVQAVLAARIDRLPPDEKSLLQCASVIGRDVPLVLLRAIAELPDAALHHGMKNLQSAELLYEPGLPHNVLYRFKHSLTHEVAYQGLLHQRCKTLHARVVDGIEQLYTDRIAEHAEALAHHAVQGEVWDKAVDYLREAGAQTFARGSVAESLDRYERALALLERLPSSPENLRRAIDVRLDLHVPLIVLGQVSRLVQLHAESERITRQLHDPLRRGRLLFRMGQHAWMSARYRDGLAHAQEALAIATEIDDPEVRVLSTYVSAVNLYGLGAYRPAIELFLRVVEGPDAERARRLLALTVTAYVGGCAWLGQCLTQVGELERALTYATRAVETADTSDHPQAQAIAYTLRAIVLVHQGDLHQALKLCEWAVALCEAKALFVWLPGALCTLGWVLAWSGRPVEAIPHFEGGAPLMETIGVKVYLPLIYGWWAEALLLAERLEDAERIANRAVESAVAAGERGHEAAARYVLARLYARRSTDVDAGAQRYEEVRAAAEELGMRPLLARSLLSLGQLCQTGGRREAAQKHLGLAVTLMREMGMRRWLAEAEEALRVCDRPAR